MILRFWQQKNFQLEVQYLLPFQMIASSLEMQMMSCWILQRFLERWSILAGRLHNRDLPRLVPLRRRILLRLEARKAAHLPQLILRPTHKPPCVDNGSRGKT